VNLPRPPFSAADVARIGGGRVVVGDEGRHLPSVSIDSRAIRPGDLFVAIRGERFDGHDFAQAAIAGGAAGVVVTDASAVEATGGAVVIEVADTLRALQELAREVRRRSGARVIAITGSAGKTTTKEATAALLEARYDTLKNQGNLNNHIGLPLSLLALQRGADVAVMELGMNHAGEIRRLVEIAEPEVRVWTNVGTAHLEFFGTREAIADAKAEILEAATRDTVAVVNADDDRVMARVAGFPGYTVTFGIDRRADVRAEDVRFRGTEGTTARACTPAGEVTLEVPLPGRGNLENVLAASAVAIVFDVPLAAIGERVARLAPAAHRGEVLRLAGGVRVLDDAYNASPSALERLLEIVARDDSGARRVAFLGEMLELGDASVRLHAEAGRAAASAGVEVLVTVGGPPARALGEAAVRAGVPAARVQHVADSFEAATLIGSLVAEGDLVVVKGSRGTRMERVVERLKEEFA
jgi:UDP-N-acetylmuramoyl-tripeptide--D-alanyl-D-alanine ligase